MMPRVFSFFMIFFHVLGKRSQKKMNPPQRTRQTLCISPNGNGHHRGPLSSFHDGVRVKVRVLVGVISTGFMWASAPFFHSASRTAFAKISGPWVGFGENTPLLYLTVFCTWRGIIPVAPHSSTSAEKPRLVCQSHRFIVRPSVRLLIYFLSTGGSRSIHRAPIFMYVFVRVDEK